MSPGVRRVLLSLNGVCVIGLLTAGLVAVFVVENEEPYPERWDPRVATLAQFVERERGHSFRHPVYVDFLNAAEYTERTRTDEESLAPEEVEDVDQGEALLRAFGLIAGDVGLLDTVNDLTDTGTLAYYDSEEERVVVRGTAVTPSLSLTLVHELTHVLQDQAFDLDRFDEDDESVTDGQLAAFRALVEGDADRIENEYFSSLSEYDQEAVEGAADGDAAAVEDEDPSQAIAALFAAPYVLGDAFVALLDTVATAKIDEAFVKPPTTEEHILDPFNYLDGDHARRVDAPDVGGLEVLEGGDFGAVAVLVVLAERVELRQALTAATVGAATPTRSSAGTGAPAPASTSPATRHRTQRNCTPPSAPGWRPHRASTATTTRNRDLIEFESCDPGARRRDPAAPSRRWLSPTPGARSPSRRSTTAWSRPRPGASPERWSPSCIPMRSTPTARRAGPYEPPPRSPVGVAQAEPSSSPSVFRGAEGLVQLTQRVEGTPSRTLLGLALTR